MKTFLTLFVLLFSSSVFADDISDFKIEGMSVGDSLLDYFSEIEIYKNKRYYFEGKRKFYVVSSGDLNLKTYDSVDIYLKTDDKQYLVHQVVGFIFFKRNFDKCKIQQKEIVNSIKILLKNSEIIESGDISHPYDPSGVTWRNYVSFIVNSDNITVECLNWSNAIEKKNPGWTDDLNVRVVNREVNYWMNNGYL